FLELLLRRADRVLVGAQAGEASAQLGRLLLERRHALFELAALTFDAADARAVILAALLEADQRGLGARHALVRVGDALARREQCSLGFVRRGAPAIQLEALATERIVLDLLGVAQLLEPRADRRGL